MQSKYFLSNLLRKSAFFGTPVSFMTLYATTMRSSIMIISHYEHPVSGGGMTRGLEAAIRDASKSIIRFMEENTIYMDIGNCYNFCL